MARQGDCQHALPVALKERDISGLKEERSSLDKHQLGPPSENH